MLSKLEKQAIIKDFARDEKLGVKLADALAGSDTPGELHALFMNAGSKLAFPDRQIRE